MTFPKRRRIERRCSLLFASLVVAFVTAAPAVAQLAVKAAPVMSRFAADVKPDDVLPDYPRPQLTREDWLNLNGVWEFQPAAAGDPTPVGKTLARQILVPFAVEFALSGVMEHHDRLWYRRQFAVPAGWGGKQVLLHFGAVDYETEVFVNGRSVGTHSGGYDPFTFDVTAALDRDGPQELIVRVFDPSDKGGQPRGKQTLKPGGAMYTTVTGIWQTVWLEPVVKGGIDGLTIVPDVDAGQVKVAVGLTGDAKNAPVVIVVKDGDRVVARQQGSARDALAIKIPDAELRSPDSPHLYDFTVDLIGPGGAAVDTVGMRKIELGDIGGVKRILLNGKFVFQLGPLDQGFWPETIYTPPAEAAIKNDIRVTKDMGFNLIRKHLKVEPARWYYWADRLDMMVWQDMPSPNSYLRKAPPVGPPSSAS